MPPEQFADSKRVDCRSDVWAAALVLWELVAGRQMFSETNAALRYQSGVEVLPKPSDVGGPDLLDDVVMKGLAREPDERFQTAREMLIAMERVVPPAPARRVAQWVQKLAREKLEERARYVEQIEVDAAKASARMRSDLSAGPALVEPPPPEPKRGDASRPTSDGAAAPAAPTERRPTRAPWGWLALAALALGLTVVAFVPTLAAQLAARRAAHAPAPSGVNDSPGAATVTPVASAAALTAPPATLTAPSAAVTAPAPLVEPSPGEASARAATAGSPSVARGKPAARPTAPRGLPGVATSAAAKPPAPVDPLDLKSRE
jgi:serine/threonine-protein kinase